MGKTENPSNKAPRAKSLK